MDGFCSRANLACTPLSKTSLRMIKATINGLSSVFQEGKQIQLPSFDKASLPPRSFLPSHYASKISITSSSDLQKIFPDLFASNPMKETIERSISFCTSPSRAGEIKTCSNSLEDMIQFSKQTLGRSSGKLLALTSKSEKGSGKELEIGKIKRLHTQKMVSCHEVFYPFATYFCHFLPSSTTRLYAVDFVDPGTKAQVNTILALCHMDTSAWPAENMALKVLKLSPGKGEACHWYGKDDLVWI
ncbi:OLC1v1007985C1 [Oldenlandia corymbosa var. corymbosa]|uniref:OLC1v1007985C1 n=1 Tax=Oldenlandia corymbosa var. corymbosa TaxID=529605 RepID=A0AAV1DNX2_OLDCO|nr:OLC1v1007985C1 [Oldenlandia corymbosa var. corymbosa]